MGAARPKIEAESTVVEKIQQYFMNNLQVTLVSTSSAFHLSAVSAVADVEGTSDPSRSTDVGPEGWR